MTMSVYIGRFVFYNGFTSTYNRMNIVQVRRKLKPFYTKSEQDQIIRYLKTNP